MASDDEYRKQAADAQMMADHVISPRDKESWLRVAQGWLNLMMPLPATAPTKKIRKSRTNHNGSKAASVGGYLHFKMSAFGRCC
jgi:hypothetical protein